MKKRRKKKQSKGRILVFILIVLILGMFIFFQTRPKLQVVTVISKYDKYDYYLESNATRIYKKYYKEIIKELKKENVDEEKYAKLVARLFLIDYYTLNNKITNKDIGGVQFIHSNLKEKFIKDSSDTIYKYVENNLYGSRKQELPEVKNTKIESFESVKYNNKDYNDENAYKVIIELEYIKNLDYPKQVELYLIHEENKLVIVEIN